MYGFHSMTLFGNRNNTRYVLMGGRKNVTYSLFVCLIMEYASRGFVCNIQVPSVYI